MKICFYCDSVFSFGGVQRVLAVIATALSLRHEVTIITTDSEADENRKLYDMDKGDIHFRYITYQTLPVYELLPCKLYSLLYKKILPKTRLSTKWYGYSSFPKSRREKLIEMINESGFDVVVGVHIFLSFHLASIKKKIEAKTIGWMHNSYDAFFLGASPYLKNQEKRFAYQMPLLDRLVVLSDYDKLRFAEDLGVGSVRLYNPVTLAPKGKGSPVNKKFLSIGRFSHLHKGFDILINAFAIFAKANSDWSLDIVGEGPEEEMLKSLISKHNLQKRVVIHPFTPDIGKHYSSASVYVLSSRWEGQPLVLLEAMSYHLPLIASAIPITMELIEDRGFAEMFTSESVDDLAEKMIKMTDRTDLEEMGNKAFEFTKDFQLEPTIERWEKLFKEIL